MFACGSYNQQQARPANKCHDQAVKKVEGMDIDSFRNLDLYDGVWQELRAQKAAENRRRTEMVRKQREEARAKKEAEQRQREAKLQEEHRRRIAAEKKKVRRYSL